MNDERFLELAMKVIARQATDAERAELDARLAQEPALRAEFERLQTDVRVAKEALPLVEATQATGGELPAYARGRLQTKVRQALGRPGATEGSRAEKERSAMWRWRWVLGLAAATAVVLLVALPVFRAPSGPVIELATLDVSGDIRGGETNEVALLQQTWSAAKLNPFAKLELLRAWETNWPSTTQAVKIIYDRNAAEVRVLGRWKGAAFQNTFPVETDLAATLTKARGFVQEQTKR